MKSGRFYAELNEKYSWEEFPIYAEEFSKLLSGEILSRNDSFDIRVWILLVEKVRLRLVYEDFPVMISLESQNEEGDLIIKSLVKFL